VCVRERARVKRESARAREREREREREYRSLLDAAIIASRRHRRLRRPLAGRGVVALNAGELDVLLVYPSNCKELACRCRARAEGGVAARRDEGV